MPPWRWGLFATLLLLAAAAYVVFTLERSLPGPSVVGAPASATFTGPHRALAWPGQGQAAAGVQGVGLIASHGSQRPTPIASVAKIMTAYIVLRDHPLQGGADGPQITVTSADAGVYQADKAAGQSVVAVQPGESLSLRQALQGLLLPSGNNIATLLARWNAGSQGAFIAKMNGQARALGLSHTHYTDPSGLQAGTTSTATDQVHLAMRALEIPAFREIVAMPEVTLPVAGRQFNVNGMLGKDGIVGVKTGSTSQAGGCFVFAAHQVVGGRTVTVVGAILHQLATRAQPSIIEGAFHASTTLLASVHHTLVTRQVVHRGQTLASIKSSWADSIAVTAVKSVSLVGWPGLPIRNTIATVSHPALPIKAGENVGVAVFASGEQRARVRLVASRGLSQPSLTWRLTHP